MAKNLKDKIKLLSESAKYDVSCSSSGSNRSNDDGVGNASYGGICHSWTSDGRCISLLKILMSNDCIFDCAYCLNRKSNNIKRGSLTVDELVNLTIQFYKRNYIEGLFLSSAIFINSDHTMEQMYLVVKKLRTDYKFNGYIHVKAIPGANIELIRKTGFLADRMSVNIELPTQKSLRMLAPQKSKENIFKPMKFIGESNLLAIEDKKKYKKTPKFVPAGQTTQMIVGATPENDNMILNLTESLYKKFHLKRVYFSAYVPVNDDPKINYTGKIQRNREHRLYQADWLLRYYDFTVQEIFDKSDNFLNEHLDPKIFWALNHPEHFPINVNKASYQDLLRIPGFGIKTCKRIVMSRKFSTITYDELKKIGAVLKRAKYFIEVPGLKLANLSRDPDILKSYFISESKNKNGKYLPLFTSKELDLSNAYKI